ncbi:assembly chaperone for ribosomal protein Rpl3, WD repeat protein Rrb1 [Schizosaccharomyces pombe]|uniref:Ribosome assembly protein rrb1 n=1 Tax=Schizosaccharomyces pombe (strain 972 / ATCC 24843) TaxID=284812 RepID=RRB1_SCHPO|nr:putative WD repeat-containing protein Rrb1 [Schizosaccharomyces pombe]Q9P783.1 RecName: Full=Ribosome assembly protein rrb1 [Schizosaccharomyces pombe 972h-]CAB88237.1 WD repeat protein Rrb1 (predicted) [Schizosaccharomyces pombe]|eukprot:NP_595880.1 putative WD repeat-containing protein Rrb1 [Schizosaccharomyces pombe]
MSKRAAEETVEFNSKNGPGQRGTVADNVDTEMGEFEDAYEDEIESEEEYIEADGEKDNGMDEEEQNDAQPSKIPWLPGGKINADEKLVADPSVYEMLHNIQVKWPFLSFDILQDSLGEERRAWPHQMYLVGGSQALDSNDNELTVMKLSQLYKTQHDENDDASDNSDVEEDPILEHKSISTKGACNRVRSARRPANSSKESLLASFHETGKVHIWDIAPHLRSLDSPGVMVSRKENSPLYTVNRHKTEGYALDWSPFEYSLLSGDNANEIFLTKYSNGGWQTDSSPFLSHTAAVEDLQWSPSEKNVFSSCSCDGTFRIWDVRNKQKTSALTVNAHPGVDVNVLSWNTRVPNLLATGADNGVWSVWDLRSLKSSSSVATPVASFKWHRAPIYSIEWHPNEDSVIGVVGADNQISLWDLSVELDEEEQDSRAAEGLQDVPPQLMFIHMGQQEIKEMHWHRQIPGTIVSTAMTGINVFKTITF